MSSASPPPMPPAVQPLSLRALQRLDEAYAMQYEGKEKDGGRSKELEFGPARDLAGEYRRQMRLDAERRRYGRKAGAAAAASPERSDRGSPSPRHGAHPSPTPRSWVKFSKPRSDFGEPPPARPRTPASSRAASPRGSSWRRGPTLLEGETKESLYSDPNGLEGSPQPKAKRAATSLRTPEQLHWHQYRRQDVLSRLTDTTHRRKTLERLQDEENDRFDEDCPFEPALCIATVMGTFPGAKRKSAVRKPTEPRDATPGANVRFVTINAPASDSDEHTDRLGSDVDVDDLPPPPTRRERALKRRAAQKPHYMEPLPLPAPVPPQPGPKLTPKAQRLKRTKGDLNRWEAARQEYIADLRHEAADAQLAEARAHTFSPQIDDHSRYIVEALGDRELDIYARSQMEAQARHEETRKRIAERESRKALDMRMVDASRAGHVRAPKPKASLSWFNSMVQSDEAYANNRH